MKESREKVENSKSKSARSEKVEKNQQANKLYSFETIFRKRVDVPVKIHHMLTSFEHIRGYTSTEIFVSSEKIC